MKRAAFGGLFLAVFGLGLLLRLAQLDGFWSEPSGADQEARHFAPVSP